MIGELKVKSEYDATTKSGVHCEYDNAPQFAFANKNSIVPFSPLQTLTATIDGNEVGPVIFDFPSQFNSMIAYDPDLAENGTFTLYFNQSNNNDLNQMGVSQLLGFLKLNAEDLNFLTVIYGQSNVNLYVGQPIDFESLPMSTLIDSYTGIGFNLMKFTIYARELFSSDQLRSSQVPFTIRVQDVNDNQPTFSQDSSFASVIQINTDTARFPQQVLKFQVTDLDSGVYGLAGISFFLLGDNAQNFLR